MAQILVANKCSVTKAEIIAIVHDDHQFSVNETMQSWVAAGNTVETWSRAFSLVKVSDRTKEDLAYLVEPHYLYVTDPPKYVGNAYHFIEPAVESELYQALLTTGEVKASWDVVSQFVVSRV